MTMTYLTCEKYAYSLCLLSEDAASGTVSLGGIDSAKYDEELAYLDRLQINDGMMTTEDAASLLGSWTRRLTAKGLYYARLIWGCWILGLWSLLLPQKVRVSRTIF